MGEDIHYTSRPYSWKEPSHGWRERSSAAIYPVHRTVVPNPVKARLKVIDSAALRAIRLGKTVYATSESESVTGKVSRLGAVAICFADFIAWFATFSGRSTARAGQTKPKISSRLALEIDVRLAGRRCTCWQKRIRKERYRRHGLSSACVYPPRTDDLQDAET